MKKTITIVRSKKRTSFKWQRVHTEERESGNSRYVFKTSTDDGEAMVILYFTPSLNDFMNKRILFARVYFKMNKNVDDFLLHVVGDDVFEIARGLLNIDNFYETSFDEYYCVSRFPSYKTFTFGCYTEESEK